MSTQTQHVKIDFSGLDRFQAAIDRDLRAAGNGPIRDAMHQWAARYRGFLQERFDKFSKGGGDWPDLAASTKRRRRKAREGATGSRLFAILRNTGTLFAALTPTFARKPGQLQEDIPFGVRVGYGGPAGHPGSPATVADIAGYHQEGKGNLPVRTIIVPPSPAVVDAMADDMQRALNRLADETGR